VGKDTGIAWAHSTFNPWMGCTKVSPGCDHCYAAVSTPVRAMRVPWGPGEPRRRTSESNWKQPLAWNRKAEHSSEPHRVFCASLADVFDNDAPEAWRNDLWALIEATPALTWMLLTKRIGRWAGCVPANWLDRFPRNVWLGITVVNQEEADRDIPKLLHVPTRVRWLSIEPQLGRVDLAEHFGMWWNSTMLAWEGTSSAGFNRNPNNQAETAIDWVITGGESGPQARAYDLAWPRVLVRECNAARVPIFVKQLGALAVERVAGYGEFVRLDYLKDRAGGDIAEWPMDLRIQEFPK
jgi:protein gp37